MKHHEFKKQQDEYMGGLREKREEIKEKINDVIIL